MMTPDPATIWREEAAATVTRFAGFSASIASAAGFPDPNPTSEQIIHHVSQLKSQRDRLKHALTRIAVTLPPREAHDLLQYIG